jgi:4-amino-4-deoxy-L-arabinose transferase-like glycosyltransferase
MSDRSDATDRIAAERRWPQALWRGTQTLVWRYWTLVVAAVVLASALVRFVGLGSVAIFNPDEITTVFLSSRGPVQAVYLAIRDNGPPLYYMIESVVLRLLPPGAFDVRLLSAAFGAASVWVTYLIGRRLFGRLVGLAAAIMLGLAPFEILVTQWARAYALAQLLVVVAVFCLVLALERPGWMPVALFWVAVTAAAYTHLFGLAACAGVIAGVLLRPRLIRRLGWPWFVGMGMSALAWLPWASVFVSHSAKVAHEASAGTWQTAPVAHDVPAAVLGAIAAHDPWGSWLLKGGAPAMYVVGAWFLVLVAAGLVYAVRESWWTERATRRGRRGEVAGLGAPALVGRSTWISRPDAAAVLGGWVAAVFVGGFAVSAYLLPVFQMKYSIVAVPAVYLLAALGLVVLWRPLAIGTVVLWIALALYQLPEPIANGYRSNDFAVESAFVQKEERAGIPVFTVDVHSADSLTDMAQDLDIYGRLFGARAGSGVATVDDRLTGSLLNLRLRTITGGSDNVLLLYQNVSEVASFTNVENALGRAGWHVSHVFHWAWLYAREYSRA